MLGEIRLVQHDRSRTYVYEGATGWVLSSVNFCEKDLPRRETRVNRGKSELFPGAGARSKLPLFAVSTVFYSVLARTRSKCGIEKFQ